MQGSWLDEVKDKDIVDYVKDSFAVEVLAINRIIDNKSGAVSNIVVTVLAVDVYLGIEQEEHEIILNPFSCDSILKTVRGDENAQWIKLLNRVNRGKLINGLTYEGAYKKDYINRLDNKLQAEKEVIIQHYKRENEKFSKYTQKIFGEDRAEEVNML